MATITIEDDDGFTTIQQWPDDKLALANASFVEIAVAAHENARLELMK